MVSFRYYATIIIDRVGQDIINVMHVPASSIEYIVESENEDGDKAVFAKVKDHVDPFEVVDGAEDIIRQVDKENFGGKITFSAS